MASAKDPVATYGFTPVPCSSKVLFQEQPANPQNSRPISPAEIPVPDTKLANAVRDYAQKQLLQPTFHHSMRVYYYGEAIRQDHFPSWTFSRETWFLTCMLHDIGTPSESLRATLMSFEFYGGMLAHALVQKEGGPREQADGVAEAIIRHQDVMTSDGSEPHGSMARRGKITALGQLTQLATLFDNVGGNKDLVNMETVDKVVKEWPRLSWSKCFGDTLDDEIKLKPWAHTTKSGENEFPEGVRNNKLMLPYE